MTLSGLVPPSITFKARLWSSEELTAVAAGWLDLIGDRLSPSCEVTALVLSNHPLSVALFFALSSLPLPMVLLAPDPRTWRSSPPIPPGTPLFLAPILRGLASAGDGIGAMSYVLPEGQPLSSAGHRPAFLTTPGLVAFTSGSMGQPKPVYITTRGLLLQVAAMIAAYQLPRGCGIAASLPLASHFGLGHNLMLPTVLGSPVALQERFEHRSLLALFASGKYLYWAGTPLMADILRRASLPVPLTSPPAVCHISAGGLPEIVSRDFLARFGVPLRPSYGRTEMGFITAETAAPADIPPGTVGRVVPSVELLIGNDPQDPLPPGSAGRIWLKGPWHTEGYGFSPRLEFGERRDGWWPTEDIGALDASGRLTLMGRADDCFKTPSGYLVNPSQIANVLTGHPGVTGAVVVPVPMRRGTVIGALVEGDGDLDPTGLRALAAQTLPVWLQPEVLMVTRELPRLPGGKVDRRSCVAILRSPGA